MSAGLTTAKLPEMEALEDAGLLETAEKAV